MSDMRFVVDLAVILAVLVWLRQMSCGWVWDWIFVVLMSGLLASKFKGR